MGVMTRSLKLGNVWKVIREVDLDAIRREALAPFDLVILGEPNAAERVRAALSPGGATIPNAVIVATGPGPRSTDLDSTLRYLVDRRIPHALAVLDADDAATAATQAAASLVDALAD